MVFLVPTLVEVYGILRFLLKGGGAMHANGPSEPFVWVALLFLGATMPLAAWILGGNGVGQTLAEDNGAFLLTRPHSRRFFLWSDVGFSFGLFGLMALAILLNYAICSQLVLRQLPAAPVALSLMVLLSGIVFIGLIYSVTYLCTIVMPRHARVLSVIVLAAYAYLHHKSHAWGGIAAHLFPTWWFNPLRDAGVGILAPHAWQQLGARVAAIVALLVIAQLVLERCAVRA